MKMEESSERSPIMKTFMGNLLVYGKLEDVCIDESNQIHIILSKDREDLVPYVIKSIREYVNSNITLVLKRK